MTIDFILSVSAADMPAEVRHAGRRAVLDLLGVAAAATRTPLSRIVRDHAVAELSAGPGAPVAAILFDGRPVSPAGAALAGGMTIDALDAHDGYRPSKGHAGCSILPAALATSGEEVPGDEFLARVIMGYEIGCRAAVALHGTVSDYHTSGAWGAVACAAVAARGLGLSAGATREALGIAEYHGPRSQMMRVIDHPTMLKDGSGWGGMAGVAAAGMAARGFTGAPAITVEGPEVAHLWADLGTRWLMLEQYIKPQPVCRWAQAAIHGAVALAGTHAIEPGRIARIEVATFDEAVRLAHPRPRSTEEAQYSLPFPVAAALVRGRLGPDEVSDAALSDPAILALAERVEMRADARANAAFPEKRTAEVTIVTEDGARHASGLVETEGDPERPIGDEALREKFRAYAGLVMEPSRVAAIEAAAWGIEEAPLGRLSALLGGVDALRAASAAE